MLPYPQLSRWMIIGCVLFSVISSADAGDSKALTRQAKAAIRAAENTNDAQLKNTKLDEARKLIDQLKAADPQNVELKTIESKYRYMDTGREATKTAARTPEVDTGKLKEVLADWNAIIKLDKDLHAKANRFFPHSGSMSYTKEQTDQVVSMIDDVMKNDQPRIPAHSVGVACLLCKSAERTKDLPGVQDDRAETALRPYSWDSVVQRS